MADCFVVGQADCGAAAAALPDIECNWLLLQAPSANTGTVVVGDSANQLYELDGGQSVSLPVTNANEVYHKRGAEGDKLTYLYFPPPYSPLGR